MKRVTLIISLYLKILNINSNWKWFLSGIYQTVPDKNISHIFPIYLMTLSQMALATLKYKHIDKQSSFYLDDLILSIASFLYNIMLGKTIKFMW